MCPGIPTTRYRDGNLIPTFGPLTLCVLSRYISYLQGTYMCIARRLCRMGPTPCIAPCCPLGERGFVCAAARSKHNATTHSLPLSLGSAVAFHLNSCGGTFSNIWAPVGALWVTTDFKIEIGAKLHGTGLFSDSYFGALIRRV
eukprot:gene111-biopygen32